MNSKIAIILVFPENPDNIGAVARAMKNMGLADLRLVQPPADWKTKGQKMAMSARDILESASVYSSVQDAIKEAHWVIGTTRRRGPKRGLLMDFQKGIQNIRSVAQRQLVAVLFGKESKGLDNKALALCDRVLTIPSHPSYPSLNLAQAVMVIAFSIFSRTSGKEYVSGPGRKRIPYRLFCNKREIEDALAHFKRALVILDYDQGNGLIDRISATMHGIFKRNGMLESEAQMIKGLSRTIHEKLKVISCK